MGRRKKREATLTLPLVSSYTGSTGTSGTITIVTQGGRIPGAQDNLLRLGHIMSNPQIVSHCPFCGSGAITRGGDETISCSFCNRAFLVMEQPQYNAMPADPNAAPPAGGLPGAETPPVPGEDPLAADPAADPAAAAPGEPPTPSVAPVNPQTDPESLKKAPPFQFGASKKVAGPFEDGIARIKAETDHRVLLNLIDQNARLMQSAPEMKATLEAQSKAARERILELSASHTGMYRTAKGHMLNEDDFVKHLAFLHDREYLTAGR